MALLRVTSEGTGEPVVWLHGFTQTRSSAPEFLASLRQTNRVLTLDLPGHGEASGVEGDLWRTADLVADAVGEETFHLAGYSFGGRVALHLALAHPERLRRLVLVSSTAGLVSDHDRTERRQRDEQLADHLAEVGTERFLDEWLAQPLFSGTRRHDREHRSRDASGLASSLRLAGTGTQSDLTSRLIEITRPVLIVAGEHDEKFVREARRLGDTLTDARVEILSRAGHAVPLDSPHECARVISEFVSESTPAEESP